jgi:alkanesulfonate monooxygenase SsuD/methylene tetrahydromethanopterin reductase-like flavin-dependent oxidoreductase (luciferase family)
MGPLVYVLPLHQPIRLVEEIAMVDQLSGGRYQVGVGPGTGGGTEFAMWGGAAAENEARFEETLQVLRRGMQTDFLTHHGAHFDYDDLWMEVRPVQQPHPPLWWAGRAETAARRGANYVGTGSIRGLTESMATYRNVLEEVARDHPPELAPPREPLYGGMKHIFVADTDEEARERAMSAYQVYRGHFAKPSRTGAAAAGAAGAFNEAARRSELLNPHATARTGQAPERTRGGPASFEPDRALELEVVLAGSPATIRDYAHRYGDVGANYFVGAFQWGDLSHAEAAHSLELFASEVMPAFG